MIRLRNSAIRNQMLAVFACGVILVNLAGCARSPQVAYYLLSPAIIDELNLQKAPGKLVSVATPSLPSYMDKDEIVERLPQNAIIIHENHRWATELDTMIRDYIITSLQERLEGVGFAGSNAKISRSADLYWTGIFTRFDIYRGERVEIVLNWHLRGAALQSPMMQNQIRISEALPDQSIASIIAALNLSLARVSDEIAGTLRHVSIPPR